MRRCTVLRQQTPSNIMPRIATERTAVAGPSSFGHSPRARRAEIVRLQIGAGAPEYATIRFSSNREYSRFFALEGASELGYSAAIDGAAIGTLIVLSRSNVSPPRRIALLAAFVFSDQSLTDCAGILGTDGAGISNKNGPYDDPSASRRA